MNRETFNRFWKGCTVLVALAVASTASATQQSEPAPGETAAQPGGPQGQATDATAQPESLPACPPAAAADNPPPCPMPPAQAAGQPTAGQPYQPYTAAHERHHNIVFAPQEVSIVTGAGPTNYFGTGTTGVVTDTGAAWDARATFGAHSIIALEAGYIGSVNNVDSPSGVQGQLYSNGLDGDLRLQLPTKVQPYIFGGVGYNRMAVNRQGSPEISSQFVQTSDNQVTIPAGGGVTGYVGRHVTLDLRGTYRLMPDNNITIMDTHALHQWYAQARVGYTF